MRLNNRLCSSVAIARCGMLLVLTCITSVVVGQDTTGLRPKDAALYAKQVESKLTALDERLDKATSRALSRLQRLEQQMAKKVDGIDGNKKDQLFGDIHQRYSDIRSKVPSRLRAYVPSLDSLTTSLKFLNAGPVLGEDDGVRGYLQNAINSSDGLKQNLAHADQVKEFIRERTASLKAGLDNLGFARSLKKLSKQSYYYGEQLKEYQSILGDHKKAERKVLDLLSKNKGFQQFMRKHSELASLFKVPGSGDAPEALALEGLQSRAQITSLLDQKIGPAGMDQFKSGVKDAQSQLSGLKDKVLKGGGSFSEDNLAEGFKPNSQRVKRFLKRVELGANIQSNKGNGLVPSGSELGLSLGYKVSDGFNAGIGLSYSVSFGPDLRHFALQHEGVGVRSFIDYKLKGSIWISGGFEMNYRSGFRRFEELKDVNAWQRSGLLGLSKIISLKTKVLKKTKVQLLWDFLSYQQAPVSKPLIFRIGYSFN